MLKEGKRVFSTELKNGFLVVDIYRINDFIARYKISFKIGKDIVLALEGDKVFGVYYPFEKMLLLSGELVYSEFTQQEIKAIINIFNNSEYIDIFPYNDFDEVSVFDEIMNSDGYYGIFHFDTGCITMFNGSETIQLCGFGFSCGHIYIKEGSLHLCKSRILYFESVIGIAGFEETLAIESTTKGKTFREKLTKILNYLPDFLYNKK